MGLANSFAVQQWEKYVVHGSSDNRHKRGRRRAGEANRATDTAKMFMPENPYFMMTLEEYNVIWNYILLSILGAIPQVDKRESDLACQTLNLLVRKYTQLRLE
ncbi:hypothetical protein HAX54_019117 [Datura stramonium]|uniref:Uncharacterized protein n=1 Tax=Datura stramonium TaxID=4076 RepID=A0ABS8UQT4_DATST|nr:hypothetical protein [Datura stramonium]